MSRPEQSPSRESGHESQRSNGFIFDNLRLVVYDFDGVMTDNRVLVSQDGTESVFCHRGDGWGVGMIRRQGIEQVILSTETNPVVMARAKKLGLECVHGSGDKLASLKDLLDERGIAPENVLYVGNDMNDYDAMTFCGFAVAPADAHEGILRIADMVTKAEGGKGVVRELADFLKNRHAGLFA
ncbi:KdsC family phosphatase [Salidesulfovibrio brasiliensis]|uniref:KdsC family phosphatase n=1 Tax=Salidesulfovibrio brasiliensis TaxID=221711 RepID=UPI000A7B8538|nr:HAD hydrolase family protein [Salidesulfovibrio brasiliensis]